MSAQRGWMRAGMAVCGGLLSWTALASAPIHAAAPEGPVSYSRDIKPIFSNRCYACHGPDEGKRQAELRLDEREVAVKTAIVPGKSSESELLKRVASTDPDEQMPPAASKKPALAPGEIELIRRWIDQGAKFDAHWAYVPPQRPAAPATKNAAWPRGEIDRFVLARLEAEGLSPAGESDRRTLARRLAFDLTGLPPKPADVEAFVVDSSAEAYEKFVDLQLASPHYGERMAMYWLDQVRYADTNGIHGDNHRDHAPYRDYVINSFNSNRPFDQFTVEQLAGDLLPNATNEQKIASGYNRLNMTTQEGGAQPKEYMAKYAADRVRNASSVWMGATLGCAECHNHKFDPFTAKDFYSFAAFFADVQEVAVGEQPASMLPLPEQEAEVKQLEVQIADAQKAYDAPRDELAAAQAQWEADYLKTAIRWDVLTPTDAKSKGGAALKITADGSIVAEGANPATDSYTVTVKTKLKGITAVRLEALSHKALPAQGPGRAANGNFVLQEFALLAPDAVGDPAPVALVSPTATFVQQNFDLNQLTDGKADVPATGWAIHGQIGQDQHVVLETKNDVGDGSEIALSIELTQNYGEQHTIGRFRLAATNSPRPVKASAGPGFPANIVAILHAEPASRNDGQKQELAAFYRTIAPLLAAERTKLAELNARRDALVKSFQKILITTAGAPREMRVLPRGNWLDESGEVVLPATPAFMKSLGVADRRATRMDLAQWIIARDNPLTARVAVNRLWKVMFGRGLVPTLDDFGSQGTLPSHPDLLDWLAMELVESGWNVKHVLKLMAMSNTYRQSSLLSPELRERDPANRLLARQSRFRLDAELVRDNALAVSGLLVRRVGGLSVKPYQPAGYWAHLNFPIREWQPDAGDNQYRRGMYTYWCRTFLHPSMLAFDAPTREECVVDRPRSNTPLQALALLNDPSYVEAARVFAARIVREGGASPQERLEFAFGQALARKPSEEEAKILLTLYAQHAQEYAAEPPAATQLATVGLAKADADLNATELAAWTSIARVILNLHETITRY